MCKTGFSKEVAEVMTSDLRRCIACLCQGKWSRFLHWYCGRDVSMRGFSSTDGRVLLESAEGAETIGPCC